MSAPSKTGTIVLDEQDLDAILEALEYRSSSFKMKAQTQKAHGCSNETFDTLTSRHHELDILSKMIKLSFLMSLRNK